jgi:hypothetical protein
LFHTTAQVAAVWHPLAEQIGELSWSLIRSAWQVVLPSLPARRGAARLGSDSQHARRR